MSSRDLPDQANALPWVSGRVLGVMAFVGMWVGCIWRRPDQWFAPQFWAEDGCIFFHDAATQGWAALLRPYGGYLSTVQRIIAGLASPLPWEYLPLVYMLAAGLITALVGMRLACARLPLLEKIFVTVALVAVPHDGEVFLNITNLQWILDILLVVNLLEDAPRTTAEGCRRSGELLLAGLSSPMVIVLAPFALGRGWSWRRSRTAWLLLGAWLIAFLVQTGLFIGSERPVSGVLGPILISLPEAVARLFATLLAGQWYHYSVELGRCAAAGGLLVLALLFSDRTNHRRGWALLMLLAAAMTLMAGRLAVTDWTHPFFWSSRYTYFPYVLAIWTLAILAAGTRQWPHRILATTLCVMTVWSAASAWTARPLGERFWPQQVRDAKTGLRTRFEVAPNIIFPVPPLPAPRP